MSDMFKLLDLIDGNYATEVANRAVTRVQNEMGRPITETEIILAIAALVLAIVNIILGQHGSRRSSSFAKAASMSLTRAIAFDIFPGGSTTYFRKALGVSQQDLDLHIINDIENNISQRDYLVSVPRAITLATKYMLEDIGIDNWMHQLDKDIYRDNLQIFLQNISGVARVTNVIASNYKNELLDEYTDPNSGHNEFETLLLIS